MIREALSRHNSKKQVADELGIDIYYALSQD